MKKVTILLAAMSLLSTSLLSNATVAMQNNTATQEKATVLFVQTAPNAMMTNVNKKNQPLKITLYEVNSKVVYFANRPVRMHGKISAEKFSSMWQTYFKNSPPNVAIETSYKTMKGKIKELTLIGTLSQPVYNPKTHSMTYTVNLEKGQTATVHHLGQTALFLDGVPFNPGGF